jgi:short-subunit dehydrogenase
MRYAGRRALVTGASSGIGEAFAWALAGRGMHLLITALPAHARELDAVAARIAAAHGTRVETLLSDLSQRDAAQHLQAAADGLAFEPDLLVNNAGIGVSNAIVDGAVEAHLDVVRVNVESVVALTSLYLRRMVARRDGAIVNVASVAAFQPTPYLAVYAASKAFIANFTEAVWAEAHPHGVRVVAICPGVVVTTRFHERFDRTEAAPGTWVALTKAGRLLQRFGLGPLTVEAVVARALAGLERDTPLSVRRAPGAYLFYLPAAILTRAMPRRQRLLTLARVFKPAASAGATTPPTDPSTGQES